MDGEDPRLVHLAAALVGPSDPGLALPRLRPYHRGAGDALRLLRLRPQRAPPGPRRARHLVLVGALAVLDPRLARGDARPVPLLSDHGPRDRVRYSFLLDRPDDHDGPALHARCPVPR